MSFAGHVLGGSSGDTTLQILEGKFEAATAQGRPRRMWLDDIKLWAKLNSYEAVKRLAEDRHQWGICSAACQTF